MFLNWEGKPKIKNSKQFSKKFLKDNLDNYANNNKLNLLIKSNNNVAISSIFDSNAINKINANGGIKLIYIDPPYFTEKDQIMKGNNKIAYQDIFDHSIEEYMNHIYIHIKLLYEILHQSGSIYIHIDYRTSSYIKIILDEIFGRKNLKGYIIWNINNGAKSKNFWSNQHNDILVYSKSDKFIFNSDSKLLKTEFSESSLKTHFRKKDSNGRAYRERIINSKKYRYFADEGKLVGSVWNDIKSMEANSPLMKEYTKYPTQKPLSLLSRIISASTNEGDIVLDSYCGSGTTLESAEKLNRNWIGIDQADESISIIKRRLKKNNFYSI
tara:strand:- start:4433 stop:5410 length:978 start_codon:yes stop_codon:yes gene_type:complete